MIASRSRRRFARLWSVSGGMARILPGARIGTMTALADGTAELPPKIGVHPRPDDSFAHAMPAGLRGHDEAGTDDLLGMKWIAGFPGNRARDLPAIHGLVV